MRRFFVAVSPSVTGQSKFFAVWAKDCEVAARIAVKRCGYAARDFSADDCLLVSEETVPVPGHTPSDLRFIPVGCVLPVPETLVEREKPRSYREAA
jgi:hypothetical protein